MLINKWDITIKKGCITEDWFVDGTWYIFSRYRDSLKCTQTKYAPAHICVNRIYLRQLLKLLPRERDGGKGGLT